MSWSDIGFECITSRYFGYGIKDEDVEFSFEEKWKGTILHWKRNFARGSLMKPPRCKITNKAIIIKDKLKKQYNIDVLPSIIRSNNGYNDKSAGEPYSFMLIFGSDNADNEKRAYLHFPTSMINKKLEIIQDEGEDCFYNSFDEDIHIDVK